LDNSQSSFPTSRSHEIPFFSEIHEWEALTFEVLYARMDHTFVDRCQQMAVAHERLEEEYHDFVESQRYVE